ncbi:hypothetical protein [Nostoc sp. MS1]|uniref:hypothetical protein n=1 Tax=Nostoc sp. MS1 TaxID=2764711 RepID=UPI001CC33E52|nr:hypothetical protein [Nostoc sp. MS1]
MSLTEESLKKYLLKAIYRYFCRKALKNLSIGFAFTKLLLGAFVYHRAVVLSLIDYCLELIVLKTLFLE